MSVKNDISEELRSLSALVATISRETPYKAPGGYFANFPELVIEKVVGTIGETAPNSLVFNSKDSAFNVPDGYFEGFARQVLARIKSGSGSSRGKSNEDEEVPAFLAAAARITPYTVLEGYFEELSPILAVAKDKLPYTVPEDYFETLSPVLAIVKDKNPYTVPAGYFERLPAEVAARNAIPVVDLSQVAAEARANGRARVFTLGKRMGWMKYAAAAVVTGLIVTVGWLRWHTVTPASGASAQVKTAFPAQMDIAKNLSKVSDSELQNFLVDQDTTLAQPVGNNAATTATITMDDNDMKRLLGDVSDGELKQYLDEHGGSNDIGTN
jgi:hypothetical protein